MYNEKDKIELYSLFEDFVLNKGVGIFLFGGFGNFDDFCHEVVTDLKEKYTFIKRVYICEDYRFVARPSKRPAWLKDEDFEEFDYYAMRYTGFYQRIYFRNLEIIEHSDFCVFYVDENRQNSGAGKALEYAKRKKKVLINVFEMLEKNKLKNWPFWGQFFNF